MGAIAAGSRSGRDLFGETQAMERSGFEADSSAGGRYFGLDGP